MSVEFSETEAKLAEIWRKVLDLAPEELAELAKESDFFELSGASASLDIACLTKAINQTFGIPDFDLPIEDCSTLSEQASWLDQRIAGEADLP